MTIQRAGPVCDVCGKYILLDKSVNPFSVTGFKNTLHCHDKCKEKIQSCGKDWHLLPAGPLRNAFEENEQR